MNINAAAGRQCDCAPPRSIGVSGAPATSRGRDCGVNLCTGRRDAFEIALKSGDTIHAKNIILALGVQGNPRRLEVPREHHPCVQTTLECAEDHHGETIVIVGGGDSAIENAIGLSEHNHVVIVNRGSDFRKAKHSNSVRIGAAIGAGKVRCHFHSRVLRIEPDDPAASTNCRLILKTADGEVPTMILILMGYGIRRRTFKARRRKRDALALDPRLSRSVRGARGDPALRLSIRDSRAFP
jgi:thioredoxin reductase